MNYNGERYIKNLLTSLQNQTLSDFEVILVDNASTDNSLGLAKKFENSLRLKIVKNKRNVGFCLANNESLRLSNGKFVIFLNNDTYVDSRWLEFLVKSAETNRNSLIVPSILHPSSCEIQEGPMSYDLYGASFGPSPSKFFYGTGACILLEKALLEQIGAFDSKLFMYQEDVDLCWRSRLYGFDIVFEPAALCYHVKESEGVVTDTIKMPVWKFFNAHCKNRIRILVKNYSKLNVIKRLPIAIFLVFVRSIALSFLNKNPQYLLCFFKGLLWNALNLRDTLRKRYKTQSLRRKTDADIAKYMLQYSIELLSFREIVTYFE